MAYYRHKILVNVDMILRAPRKGHIRWPDYYIWPQARTSGPRMDAYIDDLSDSDAEDSFTDIDLGPSIHELHRECSFSAWMLDK